MGKRQADTRTLSLQGSPESDQVPVRACDEGLGTTREKGATSSKAKAGRIPDQPWESHFRLPKDSFHRQQAHTIQLQYWHRQVYHTTSMALGKAHLHAVASMRSNALHIGGRRSFPEGTAT